MKRTFKSEDERKNALFKAWNDYLADIHTSFDGKDFQRPFDGMATVLELGSDYIRIQMEDARKIHLVVSPDVAKHTLVKDSIFLAIGLRDSKWWPLDVISIGTVIEDGKAKGIHVTFNPLYVGGEVQQGIENCR